MMVFKEKKKNSKAGRHTFDLKIKKPEIYNPKVVPTKRHVPKVQRKYMLALFRI